MDGANVKNTEAYAPRYLQRDNGTPQHYLKSLLFFVLLLFLNAGQAQQDKGLIWEVQTDTAPLYLLGSIHFANSGFYPLRREIERAFNQSDNLVVEVDIAMADPLVTQQLLMRLGTYQGQETLRDHISDSTYRLLVNHLNQQNLPVELFLKQKPGMLVMTLTSMELIKHGLSPDQGIDLHFLSRARGTKNILELETLEEQLDLLLNTEHGDQMLKQTVEEFSGYGELIKSITTAWKQGNTRKLEEILIDMPLREYPESRPTFEKMFIQRNLKMTEKIKAYLKSGQSHFVVVGAGHLIGNGSIVDLLRRAGYRVTQL